MGRRLALGITMMMVASAPVIAADPAAAEREKSKEDWLQQCVVSARQRNASVTESEARSTCKKTTGSGSATRAVMPGHSGPPTDGAANGKAPGSSDRKQP